MATLYLVSTPIGNLGDLSERAAEVLRSVDRVLAEDTRRTRTLTDHVGSSVPMVSLHAHNERQRAESVLAWLDAGEDLALVSDAGTPLVSDPGATLVATVAEAGHRVVPIPGASAVLAALVASGLPTERFAFLGFAPRKGRLREALLARISGSDETLVLFESPQRTVTLLGELAERCGPGRRAVVARELTKLHEEIKRGTLSELAAYYEANEPRGEVTVVIAPMGDVETEAARQETIEAASRLASELLASGLRPSAAAKEVAGRLDLGRNEAYRIVHGLREGEASPDDGMNE